MDWNTRFGERNLGVKMEQVYICIYMMSSISKLIVSVLSELHPFTKEKELSTWMC